MNTLQGVLVSRFYAPDMYKIILHVQDSIFYSQYEPSGRSDVSTMLEALEGEAWYEMLIHGTDPCGSRRSTTSSRQL